EAAARHDVERRRLLVMERTERAEVLARTLQRHLLAHDLDDVGARADLVDDGFRDHCSSTTVTPVPPSPSPPGLCVLTLPSALTISVTTSRSAPVPFPCMMRSAGSAACTAASSAGTRTDATSSARSPRRSISVDTSRSGLLQPPRACGRCCTVCGASI